MVVSYSDATSIRTPPLHHCEILCPSVNMCRISCFGHTMVALTHGGGTCVSIQGIIFNLLQVDKCQPIHLCCQVGVRWDKNMVLLSYKVIT